MDEADAPGIVQPNTFFIDTILPNALTPPLTQEEMLEFQTFLADHKLRYEWNNLTPVGRRILTLFICDRFSKKHIRVYLGVPHRGGTQTGLMALKQVVIAYTHHLILENQVEFIARLHEMDEEAAV